MGKENSWETLNFLYQYTNKKINKDGFFSWLHRKPWPDHFLFTLPCSFPRIGLNFSLLQIPHYFYSFLGSSSSSSSFFPVRILSLHQFTSAQFSHLVVSDFVIPWSAACQASLSITNSITNSQSLLKLMCIESVMPSAGMLCYAKSLQSCPTLCDPIDGSHQAPPSLGFSRQEQWSELPFPSPMHESEKWKQRRAVVSDS